jgi:inner membrane protein involved in colicin E2 resistance
MRIGHTGRTRVEELVIATVLLLVGVRSALPLGTTVYGQYWIKAVFAVILTAPAVLLYLSHTLEQRKRALLFVFITFAYSGVLTVVLQWQSFASAGMLLGFSALSGYLYYLTRGEIKWTQQHSSPSSLPDPVSPDTSSSE